MKSIVLDSSTIITLASTCLLNVFSDLKKMSGVQFFIPPGVEEETIGKSFHIDRFMLEGIRVYDKISDGTIKIEKSNKVRELGSELLTLVNHTFTARGKPIQLIHMGEAEVIALARLKGTPFIGIDEKTTRLLIEAPQAIQKWMRNKLHTSVTVNQSNLKALQEHVKGIKVLRSSDIVAYAYKKGLFDKMIPSGKRNSLSFKENFVKGFLWALRFSGCAIREEEIENYQKYLLSN
jgi:hypothetical protein